MNINWEGVLPIQGEIVVVEDDPTLGLLMKDILAEIGATSLVFETADDALTYLLQAHDQCVLVIADQGLPGQVQGAEFIEMVTGKWPSIAAILTSGYHLDSTTVPSSAIYLLKPWSLDELVVAVAALLQPGYPIRRT